MQKRVIMWFTYRAACKKEGLESYLEEPQAYLLPLPKMHRLLEASRPNEQPMTGESMTSESSRTWQDGEREREKEPTLQGSF